MSEKIIAALYVMEDGPYKNIPGVDAWDEVRDARLYAGPYPVIAHPPCQRWGRYWNGGPSAKVKCKLGDDNGCFEAALASVRKYGGVLEHPEASHAWKAFGLNRPPFRGGWVKADEFGGWTCCVSQGNYGHKAVKMTWLYAVGVELPEFKWGRATGKLKIELSPRSKEHAIELRRLKRTGVGKRLSKRQRTITPIEFRDALIKMVRSAK